MTANGRGNMRPAGRSPPFLAIGLFVALVILGFNYWSLSARNGEQANEINVMESELRLVNAKKTSAEKRNEAVSEKVTDLEKQLNEQKELVARNQAEIANVEREKQTFIERTSELENEVKNIRDQQLPLCETDKRNLQQEVEQLRADIDVHKNKQCDRRACESYVLKERDATLEDVYKVVGAIPLISMYRSNVNLGSYKDQIASLAAKALEKGQKENVQQQQQQGLDNQQIQQQQQPDDLAQQQQPVDSAQQQQQQPVDSAQQQQQQQQQQQPVDPAQQQQQSVDSAQQQQQPVDPAQQQQQPVDPAQQQQQPVDPAQQQQQPVDPAQQQQQPVDLAQQQQPFDQAQQQQPMDSNMQQQQAVDSMQQPQAVDSMQQQHQPGNSVEQQQLQPAYRDGQSVNQALGQTLSPAGGETGADRSNLNAEGQMKAADTDTNLAQAGGTDNEDGNKAVADPDDYADDDDDYDDDDDEQDIANTQDNTLKLHGGNEDDDYDYDDNGDDGDYNYKEKANTELNKDENTIDAMFRKDQEVAGTRL